MKVCIIDTERPHEKRYQIMAMDSYGFNHIYPGKMFYLEQAKEICKINNFKVIAVGNMWQCL